MKKNSLYESINEFLGQIENHKNKELLNTIRIGAKVCFEGPQRDLGYQSMQAIMPLSTPFFNKGRAELEDAEDIDIDDELEDDAFDDEDDIGHGEGYPNIIKGGIGDELSIDDVDMNELEMGIEVESEHTPDRETAADIAFDHLVEIPDYYTRLKRMEAEAKEEWASRKNK